MKNYYLTIFLLWTVVKLVHSVARRKKPTTIQSFHQKTGEPIAVNNLLRTYEKEHQKLYWEGIEDGAILQWPALDDKNLSTYCRKYLQHSVPTRTTDNVIGTSIIKPLHYEKENISIINRIVIVQCNLYSDNIISRSYYITKTAKPNCVFALKNAKYKKLYNRFTIINEHCDFEEKPYRSLKRKWVDTIIKTHSATGQPIAKDEYLLKYELEHNDLLKKEVEVGKYIRWPHAVLHSNLNSYCYQYMKECVPNRNRDGIKGSLKIEKLHYQKLKSHEDIQIITVSCMASTIHRLHYHITRATETNCVYALLRKGNKTRGRLVIVFKHCDFEETNVRQTLSQGKYTFDRNIIPKLEIKVETHETFETLQLFPND